MDRLTKIKESLAQVDDDGGSPLIADVRWAADEIDRLQGIIKEAIEETEGFEQAERPEESQELYEIVETCQTILYKSGLAAESVADNSQPHVEPPA